MLTLRVMDFTVCPLCFRRFAIGILCVSAIGVPADPLSNPVMAKGGSAPPFLVEFNGAEDSDLAGSPAAGIKAQVLDAGVVCASELVHYRIAVRNAKDLPLRISVKPACGCTAAEFDPVIAAGGDGQLVLTLRTAGLSGRVSKNALVTTDDPQQPAVRLTLAATIIRPISADLPAGSVIPLDSEGPTVREFEVRISPDHPARLQRVDCDRPFASAALLDSPERYGYRVRLTLGPEAPLGRTPLSVMLHTDHPQQRMVRIPIVCEKGIVAAPATLHWKPLDRRQAAPPVRHVMLKRAEGAFEVLGVECSDGNFEAQVRTLQHGTRYLLAVRYRGDANAGPRAGTIRVKTDDPDQAVVEIMAFYGSPSSVSEASFDRVEDED